ncbi:hypothetical protein FACS1894105_05400 [Clostridia bacterium]|nr:hypothetical protein FACS1894105_05400 [Clostridia bacterium]
MTTKKPIQRIELVALDRFEPAGYQRVSKDYRVANIVREFDEAKLGTITVSLRGGVFHVVDGAHRAKALRERGYTHALCVVLTGLTYEQEAAYFRKQNENRSNISQFEDFKAGLNAKDNTCMKIDEIVKDNGFQFGMGGGFRNIASIKTLTDIAENFGFQNLDDTLCLIANTWSGVPSVTNSQCIYGVAEFINRYGMRDFADRMKNKYAVVCYDYFEATRVVHSSIHSAISRKKYCKILVEHYNKGFAHNNKKRLVWED